MSGKASDGPGLFTLEEVDSRCEGESGTSVAWYNLRFAEKIFVAASAAVATVEPPFLAIVLFSPTLTPASFKLRCFASSAADDITSATPSLAAQGQGW